MRPSYVMLSFLPIISAVFTSTYAQGEGTTLSERKEIMCVRDESVQPSFVEKEMLYNREVKQSYLTLDTINWIFVDSISMYQEIPPQGRVIFSINTDADTIDKNELPDTLPSLVKEAIDYAPSWLRAALIDNFRQLTSDYQQIYANLILNANPHWVDEIAFQVAHIGYETLMDTIFEPTLIVENTRFLYKNDSLLQYVDIIDYGAPTTGGDYYSTTRYWVVENDDTIQYELPREYYYYYVVHPQLSDESPRMDAYVYNKIWREYLFYDADPGYPVLSDKLKGVKILWDVTDTAQVYPAGRPFDSTDCALNIIGNWTTETVPEAATGNRPIQPNVIAHEHNGNCGELQDILQAAARSALIPVVATMDPCEDHVWNEFYYKGWHEYQVDLGHGSTHINDPSTGYDVQHGGGKRVSSIWNWRSDGYPWTVTSRYSNVCYLHVEVLDAWGLPVDGARILLYSEYLYGGLTTTTIGFTNSMGRCDFELGELRNFYAHINTTIGDYPEGEDETVKIISYSQTGAHYYKTFYIHNFIASPRAKLASPPTDSVCAYKLEISLNVPHELIHGYMRARHCGRGCECDPSPYYHTYSEEVYPGNIDLYIVDDENYSDYLNGEEFQSLYIAENVSADTFAFVTPYLSKWYVIVSNEDALTTTRGLDITLKLYKNPTSFMYTVGLNNEKNMRKRKLRLTSITPNPLMKCATISYELPSSLHTNLKIYDGSGRLVRTLVDTKQKPGTYEVIWDGKDCTGRRVSSGIYFCNLTAPNYNMTRKIVVIRE